MAQEEVRQRNGNGRRSYDNGMICPYHDNLCKRVEWIYKLMLSNLGATVLGLIGIVGGLLLYIARTAPKP